MTTRPRSLPGGWYPESAAAVTRTLTSWETAVSPSEPVGVSGVVPHAGWGFSGKLAFSVIRRLSPEVQTVVVVGGHLPGTDKILASREDSFEVPQGVLLADSEFLEQLDSRLRIDNDTAADNTVEINLPFIFHVMPRSRVVCLRVSPTTCAVRLGETLHLVAERLGRSIAVVGSTDLTHYGPGYGFTPQGPASRAVEWVKKQNDRSFIEALLKMELSKAIELAATNRSACSAGAAVASAAFAGTSGCKGGTLVGYHTSWDLYASDSFVGYAGIIFSGN